jgi:hypothetical protein
MIDRENPTVTILCSGVALGVYIPALLLNYQLQQQHLKTEVVILEHFYTPESQQKLKVHKQAYHQNFSMALMGHKMTRDIQVSLDNELVNSLLSTWEAENRGNFIVWSGFWMPIIEKYRHRVAPRIVNVDLCRIDADVSATFKNYTEFNENDREIWLWHWAQKKLVYELPVTTEQPIPYQDRANRFVIHGGGWGIGTYTSKIAELSEREIHLDIVAYEVAESIQNNPNNRYFMVDPTWSPWLQNKNDPPEFPPFGAIDNPPNFKNRAEYHELFDVIRQSKAIISKPGGGTLIDSLASATPIILLEPYGYAEQSNSDIWEYLGYGISYEKWKEMNYDLDILTKLHQNILNRDRFSPGEAVPTTINYAESYAKKLTVDS